MAETHVRVEEIYHEKMKQICKKRGIKIKEVYDEAISEYIKKYNQEEIIQDSGIENLINERIAKLDKHLSSMLARTGIDTSMTLMGILVLLEKLLKVDRKKLEFELRRQGVNYFTSAVKEDKEKKKEIIK